MLCVQVLNSLDWQPSIIDYILYLKCLTQACLPALHCTLSSFCTPLRLNYAGQRGGDTMASTCQHIPLSQREMLCLCPAKCAHPEEYRYYLPISMVTVAY